MDKKDYKFVIRYIVSLSQFCWETTLTQIVMIIPLLRLHALCNVLCDYVTELMGQHIENIY